jgi:hypothetical protein
MVSDLTDARVKLSSPCSRLSKDGEDGGQNEF